MGSFGALAAMNEAIKKNRAMLKAGRKKPFVKDRHYFAKRGEAIITNSKPLDEAERMQLINRTWTIRRGENRKLALAFIVSLAIVSVLVYIFITA